MTGLSHLIQQQRDNKSIPHWKKLKSSSLNSHRLKIEIQLRKTKNFIHPVTVYAYLVPGMGKMKLFAIREGMYGGEAAFSLASPCAEKVGKWFNCWVHHRRWCCRCRCDLVSVHLLCEYLPTLLRKCPLLSPEAHFSFFVFSTLSCIFLSLQSREFDNALDEAL